MATRTDLYGVLFKELTVEEGFNVRYDYGDIQELADNIVEHGIQTPIHAYQKKGDINRYTIVEGHRRMKAVELAIKQKKLDPENFRIPMVKSKPQSDESRTIGLITYNSGKPLTMLEEAIVFDRLDKYGMSVTDIQKKVSRSSTHITNCLLLISANLGTKKMIMEGVVKPTLVVDLLRTKSPKEVEDELKGVKAELTQKAVEKEIESPAPGKGKEKDDDVPEKKDNTKTSGKDTRQMPEAKSAPAVKITKKHLHDKPKEKKYIKDEVLELLADFKAECISYKKRNMDIGTINVSTWLEQQSD